MDIRDKILNEARRHGWTDVTAAAVTMMDGIADGPRIKAAHRFAKQTLAAMVADGLLEQRGSDFIPTEGRAA